MSQRIVARLDLTARTRKASPALGNTDSEDRAITPATPQLRNRIDQLADDIGRLRCRCLNDLDAWTLERIAGHIETLDVMLGPSVAELAATTHPGCDETIDAALEAIELRRTRLRRKLGSLDPFDLRKTVA